MIERPNDRAMGRIVMSVMSLGAVGALALLGSRMLTARAEPAAAPAADISMPPPRAARVEKVNPAGVALAAIAAKPDAGRPTVQSDPTLELSPPAALSLTPPARKAPAPLLLTSIPDPSRQPGALTTPPAKEDAPVLTFDRPTKPMLPAAK